MKRNFIILCLGILLGSCSMYWTEGSVPIPRGGSDSQDQKTAEERAKEQKDLYDSVGLGDEDNGMEDELDELSLVNKEKNEQNNSNGQEGHLEVGTGSDEDFVLEIDEGDVVRTEETETDETSESSESIVTGTPIGAIGTVSSSRTGNEEESEDVNFDPNVSGMPPVQVDEPRPQEKIADQEGQENSNEVVAVQETSKDREISIKDICNALTYIRKRFTFLPEFNNEKLNFIANLKASRNYLCNHDGINLKTLRNNSYDGVNTDESTVYVDKIFDEQKMLVTSYAAYGTATRDDETTLEAYDYVNKNYCTTFKNYSQVYGPEYVKDIKKLEVISSFSNTTTPDIHTTQGCSYHLVSSKIAGLITPEYNGVSFLSKFLGGKLLIEVNYIIKSISAIKDLLTVTIAYKDEDGYIQSFSYRYSSADTYFYHSKFVSDFTAKAQEITRNRLLALQRVTRKMKSGEFK